MVLTLEEVRLGLDPGAMRQGARESVDALMDVTRAAKETAIVLDRETQPAISDTSNDLVTLEEVVSETERATTKLNTGMRESSSESRRMTESISVLDRVLEIAGGKAGVLSKAFIGMFAVDVVAKVFGFNSAMDLLHQTIDAVATGVAKLFDDISGESRMRAARERVKSIVDEYERLAAIVKELEGPKKDVYNIGGRAFDLSRFAGSGNEDLYLRANRAARDAADRYAALEQGVVREGFKPGDDSILYQSLLTEQAITLRELNDTLDDLTKTMLDASAGQRHMAEVLREVDASRARDRQIELARTGGRDGNFIGGPAASLGIGGATYASLLRAGQLVSDELARGSNFDRAVRAAAAERVRRYDELVADALAEDQSNAERTAYESRIARAGGTYTFRDTLAGDLDEEARKARFDRDIEERRKGQDRLDVSARAIAAPFGEAVREFAQDTSKAGEALRGLGQELYSALVERSIVEPIVEYFAKAFATSTLFATVFGANGLAMSGGSIVPMALGGAITSPTYFPLANGGAAVGGEAGDELLFPATRDRRGRLAVSVVGGRGAGRSLTLVQNFYASQDYSRMRYSGRQTLDDFSRRN